MSPALFKEMRDEIQTHIKIEKITSQIVHFTDIERITIDKMKRNLIKYDDVINYHQIVDVFKKIESNMKNHLLK